MPGVDSDLLNPEANAVERVTLDLYAGHRN